MKCVRSLYKIGGSLSITIPSRFTKTNNLTHGSMVLVDVESERVIITMVTPEMLGKAYNGNNKPPEIKGLERPKIISGEVAEGKREKQQREVTKWQK